jgi:hypothetical protein
MAPGVPVMSLANPSEPWRTDRPNDSIGVTKGHLGISNRWGQQVGTCNSAAARRFISKRRPRLVADLVDGNAAIAARLAFRALRGRLGRLGARAILHEGLYLTNWRAGGDGDGHWEVTAVTRKQPVARSPLAP